MKNKSSIIIYIIFFLTQMPIFAQFCENSVYSTKGNQIIITEYDENDTVKSTTEKTIIYTEILEDSKIAKIQNIKTEANGVISEDKIEIRKCENNAVTFIQDAIDTKTKKEAEIVYPHNMRAGMDLKDEINFEYSSITDEGQKVKLSVKIKDRKVVDTEKVTLKSGSWYCLKITYNFTLKLKLGFIGIPMKANVTEWYNPEVGVVKNETYINGKLTGHSEITSIKRQTR